jgi:hypothetical protein
MKFDEDLFKQIKGILLTVPINPEFTTEQAQNTL